MTFICSSLHSEAIAAGLRSPIQQSLAARSLTNPTVEVNGRDVTLRGTVDSEATKQQAGDVAARQWGTYQATNLLEVRQPAAPAPEASLDCQAKFSSILKAGQPLFVTASSALFPISHPLLDRIVQAAGQGSAAQVTVGGHTDPRGALATNLDLSRVRANSVLSYLTAKDIAASPSRLKGSGPTSLSPTMPPKPACKRTVVLKSK